MPLDLDYEVRFALFEHISRIRNASGYVTSAQLNEGMQFRGERVPIWNQMKGIFRPRILRFPGAALTIQTAFAGPYDDHAPEHEDWLLYRYRGRDPQHPDNVALRRAGELRRPLLYLIAVAQGVYAPVFPTYVTRDDPDDLAVYLVADREGIISPESDIELGSPLKAYVTREVKMRLHQGRFRTMVLTAYRRQCSMCRLRHLPLLDAAHIIEDRHERGLPEITNGLSLCKIHHTAFDVGILGIDPDYRIHLRQDVLDEHDGPMLRHGLQEMHGGVIQVPRSEKQRPDRELLAQRFDRFRVA
ncbi:MAG: HNH endonuclease [Longimicrobiales bacterium]